MYNWFACRHARTAKRIFYEQIEENAGGWPAGKNVGTGVMGDYQITENSVGEDMEFLIF